VLVLDGVLDLAPSTLNMIFSVAYHLKLRNAIFMYCTSYIYQQMLNS
jgi:hypothetical protein